MDSFRDSFRIVIAGCGNMARTWANYALQREDAEIVALVDLSAEAANRFAEGLGLRCPRFTEIGEAVRSTGANLVFDITIPAAHRNITVAALQAGCCVMGEKPIAASMEEAREMIAAARETGRSHAVMQNRRYLKQIRAFRELATGGIIGDIGIVCADFFLAPHFGGFRDAMDSPLLLDMAIHTFDQARFITGADPVSVYCHEFNPAGSWYRGNAAAVCLFEMTDGSVFSYRGSWCAEGAPTSWESSWRIAGSRGTAVWDGAEEPYAEIAQPPAGERSSLTNERERVKAPSVYTGREGHWGCLDEMFAALREGRRAETDATDHIKSFSMVMGAIESAATGKKVSLL